MLTRAQQEAQEASRLAEILRLQLPHTTDAWRAVQARSIVLRHGFGCSVRYVRHDDHAARQGLQRACTAHDQTTGGRCLHCRHRGDDHLDVVAPGQQPHARPQADRRHWRHA